MSSIIYLDHNVLDAHLKGRIGNLAELIASKNGIAVYSQANLHEIRNSKGYEKKFLNVLAELSASFLDFEITSDGRPAGRYRLVTSDPFVEFEKLEEALADAPTSNYGLDGLLQKLYGGNNDVSFTEIATRGLGDAVEMLSKALEECRGELSSDKVAELESQISTLKEQAAKHSAEFGRLLDNNSEGSNTAALERALGVGPSQLNNIRPPHVVEQVWSMLSPKLSEHISFEQFFGLVPFADDIPAPKNLIEKANAIYHALNFVGFYRDKGMKELKRVHASSSDMTHAGYATVCTWLITGDLGLAKKAEAIYEYLEINTRIHRLDT